MAELTTGFHCGVCNLSHATLPLSFSMKVPLAATRILRDQVASRVVLNPDQCVIDNARYFLRGRLPIPVKGLPEPFIWGVWAEISPKNFFRTHQRWNTVGREKEAAYAGWLDTDLAIYGTTLQLKVTVHTQVVGRRPHFRVAAAEHPLAKEQAEGVSLSRVEEIAAQMLHTSA